MKRTKITKIEKKIRDSLRKALEGFIGTRATEGAKENIKKVIEELGLFKGYEIVVEDSDYDPRQVVVFKIKNGHKTYLLDDLKEEK